MTRRGDETRASLVEAAAALFEERGYHAAGVKAILERADAPRGSFYFHFPGGKEELAIAAIEAGAKLLGDVIAAAAAHPTPQEAFAAAVDLLAARLEDSDYTKGCPVTTVALEATESAPALAEACDQAYRAWTRGLAEILGAAGWEEAVAMERAELLLASVEGALILARVRRSRAPLERLVAQLPVLLTR